MYRYTLSLISRNLCLNSLFSLWPLDSKQGAEGSHGEVIEDEEEEGMEDRTSGEGEEEGEEDSEEEEPASDPLVFSREEFDAGESGV